MNRLKNILFFIFLNLLIIYSINISKKAIAFRALQIDAGQFYIQEFIIEPGNSLAINTAAANGTDEVLHLLEIENVGAFSVWNHIKSNDNYSEIPPIWCNTKQVTARIVHQNNTSITKRYILIVRAKDISLSGTAELCVNNTFRKKIPVGGSTYSSSLVTFVPNGKMFFIPQPGGSEWPVSMSFPDANGLVVGQWAWAGGAGNATTLSMPSSPIYQSHFVGTPLFVRADGTEIVARPGQTRFYVNDTIDADGDGLGNDLEKSLGLCDTPNPTSSSSIQNCRYTGRYLVPDPNDKTKTIKIAEARDTDRDGLPDNEELLGYIGKVTTTSDDVMFPRWGADPRQKDIFLALAMFPGVNLNTQTWTPSVRSGAATTMNWIDVTDAIRQLFLLAPHDHVYNPNNQDGINIHFDYGESINNIVNLGMNERHFAHLSDEIIHAVSDLRVIEVNGSLSLPFCIDITIPSTSLQRIKCVNPVGLSPLQILKEIDEQVELLRFLNVPVSIREFSCQINSNDKTFLIEDGGRIFNTNEYNQCDSASARVSVTLDTTDTEIPIVVQIQTSPNENNIESRPFFHSNHLFDKRYIPTEMAKRVRYSVVTNGDQNEGQATDSRLILRGDLDRFPHTLTHEFGHTIGLSHWGHSQWYYANDYLNSTNREIFLSNLSLLGSQYYQIKLNDFNHLPHYKSVMNYNFGLIEDQFSNHDNLIALNPSNTKDINIYNISNPLQRNYGDFPWFLTTNAQPNLLGVDWNRDGNPSQNIGHNVSLQFGLDTSAFINGRQLLGGFEPFGTIDIVRSEDFLDSNFLHAFYVREATANSPGGSLFHRFANIGDVTNGSCTGPSNPLHYPTALSSTEGCLNWSEEKKIIPSDYLSDATSFWFEGKIFVATIYHNAGLPTNRQILVHWYSVGPTGILTLGGTFMTTQVGLYQGIELALIYRGISETERLTLVFNMDNEYNALYWNGSTFVSWIDFNLADNAQANNPHTLSGRGKPSLVSWPDPFNNLAKIEESKDPVNKPRTTCGVFPTINQAMRIYCFDPATGQWREISQTVFANQTNSTTPITCQNNENFEWVSPGLGYCLPTSVNPPEIAMRYVRLSNGSPTQLQDSLSHFQLVFSPNVSMEPQIWISDPLSVSSNHPLSGSWSFDQWRGDFLDRFPITKNTNVPMYEDSKMGGLFSLGSYGKAIYFQPFTDGSPNIDLSIGSDFRVMEDHTCSVSNKSTNYENVGEQVISPPVQCGIINVLDYLD